MSTLQTKTVRLGDSATLANNFELVVPPVPDGTLTLQRQSGTDILTVNASGQLQSPQGFESGTYVPVIEGFTSVGVGTYTFQAGLWQKFGNICWVQARVTWTAHTGTGIMRVTLPFTVATGGYAPIPMWADAISASASQLPILLAASGLSKATFYNQPLGGGSITAINVDTAGDIIFQGTFFTA